LHFDIQAISSLFVSFSLTDDVAAVGGAEVIKSIKTKATINLLLELNYSIEKKTRT
jgi:hypothetical protein